MESSVINISNLDEVSVLIVCHNSVLHHIPSLRAFTKLNFGFISQRWKEDVFVPIYKQGSKTD
jgi:hypothetical protein